MERERKKTGIWHLVIVLCMIWSVTMLCVQPVGASQVKPPAGDEDIDYSDLVISAPTQDFTPKDSAGGALTYTFTGDSHAKHGFVANVTSYDSSILSSTQGLNGLLQIPAEITYLYTPPGKEEPVKLEGVEVVGVLRGAFKGCTTLRELNLPDTLTYIGQEAFSECSNLAYIRTYAKGKDPEPGQSGYLAADTIEYRAFSGCTALGGITLGEKLDSRGGVQIVQQEAFMGCTGLTSVEIGSTVERIEGGAFANCNMLSGTTNDLKIRDNQSFFLHNGILYYRQNERSNILIMCPCGTSVGDLKDFPQNVTQIRNEAFYGCIGLTSVVIPDTVQTIGDQAFYGCTNLGNVTIPASVTNIGTNVFKNCGSGLCIICISGSVAENYANSNNIAKNVACTVTFYNTFTGESKTSTVTSGQTVDPPMGWEREGYVLRWSDDFSSNTIVTANRTVSTVWKKLYTVTFRDSVSGNEAVVEGVEEGTEASPPEWTREGYVLTWSTETYKRVTANLVVNAIWLISWTDDIDPDDTPKTGDFVPVDNIIYKITNYDAARIRVMGLEDTSVSSVKIPASVVFGGRRYKVTAINANAFRGNTYITKVTIGKNVTAIGHHAFYRCTSLKKLDIRSRGISKFGYYALKRTKTRIKVLVPTKGLVRTYRMEMLDAGLSIRATVRKR